MQNVYKALRKEKGKLKDYNLISQLMKSNNNHKLKLTYSDHSKKNVSKEPSNILVRQVSIFKGSISFFP